MVTLTKQVIIKVEEVCERRPSLTKTVLDHVGEVVSLQEINQSVLDDGLKDFFLRRRSG